MLIADDSEPRVMMRDVDGERKNWDRGFDGSTFLSFFCFYFEICGICFSTSETMTGGYKSMLLTLRGSGLAFSPGISLSGIRSSAPRLEILSQIWLVKSENLIPF